MKAYGYARISKKDQSEYSLAVQESDINEYYQDHLKSRGIEWGGVLSETASAFKRKLRHRPNGSKLMRLMDAGDHLIVAKPDRVFRGIVDFGQTTGYLKRMEIYLHVTNLFNAGVAIDGANPIGEMILTILVAFGQFESSMISIRTKEGLSKSPCLRARTSPQKMREAAARVLVHGGDDKWMAEQYERVKKWYLKGMSNRDMRLILEREECDRRGEDFNFNDDTGHWSRARVQRMAIRARNEYGHTTKDRMSLKPEPEPQKTHTIPPVEDDPWN